MKPSHMQRAAWLALGLGDGLTEGVVVAMTHRLPPVSTFFSGF